MELVDIIGDCDEDRSGLDVQQFASTSSMSLARMTFSWIEGPVPQLNDIGRLRAGDEDTGSSMVAAPQTSPFTAAHELGRA